jgi:hypothetical protein
MSNTVQIKTMKEMLEIFGQPFTASQTIRFLPNVSGYDSWGKSNLFHYFYTKKYREKNRNKLVKQKTGWYKITITDNPVEKLEWCFTSLGRGSNNPKAMWRTRWIQLEDVRLGYQSYITIYLHPESAALYRLMWGAEEFKESDDFKIEFDW